MNANELLRTIEKLSPLVMRSFDFMGMRVQVLDVLRADHHPNWQMVTHYHPWFEFNYVSTGRSYTSMEKEEFCASAGLSYLIPPGVSHAHRGDGTGDDGLCIRFRLQAEENHEIARALSLPHPAPFEASLDSMDLSGGLYSLQAEYAAWLIRMYETLFSKTLPSAYKNTFSEQVTLYLEKYYYERITIDQIAGALNTSRRTLARKFMAESGQTVFEKLSEIRLHEAKKLLISTELPLYVIAEKCGFANEYYFSKVFKEHEKTAPKFYRDAHPLRIREQ